MKKYNFQNIDILIADQNIQLRGGLKGMMHQSGFRSINDASNLEQMEEIITAKCPDLLLCDVSLPGGDVCKSISKLRHSHLGQNPFCSVILFIDAPTEEIVRAASLAGLDDLQVKPIVAQKVLDRITFLIEKRKPFVVTTDYIGPDRRKGQREGAQVIPTFDVPNSIKGKAKDEFVESEFRAEVNNSLWEINSQKIERHAFQISYLVERIVPAYRNGEFNKQSIGYTAKLVQTTRDIGKRLEESNFDHLSGLVDTLSTVAESLWKSGTSPKPKDLDLLTELSAAIQAAFKSAQSSGSIAGEISSSVQQKYKP